jgi:hypothetical protein
MCAGEHPLRIVEIVKAAMAVEVMVVIAMKVNMMEVCTAVKEFLMNHLRVVAWKVWKNQMRWEIAMKDLLRREIAMEGLPPNHKAAQVVCLRRTASSPCDNSMNYFLQT